MEKLEFTSKEGGEVISAFRQRLRDVGLGYALYQREAWGWKVGREADSHFEFGRQILAGVGAGAKKAGARLRESSGGDELGRERNGAGEERQYPLRKGVLESWKVMGMEGGSALNLACFLLPSSFSSFFPSLRSIEKCES